MAENTVEFVIRANVDQFRTAIQSGRVQFEGQIQRMARAASSGGRQIDTAFGRLGIRPLHVIQREIRLTSDAYQRLGAAGGFSAKELARAAQAARGRIAELRAEMGSTGKAGEQFGSALGRAGHRMTAIAAAALSLRQVLGGVRQVLDVGGEFETLGKRMEAAMRSIADGERATAWVRNFAVDTPYQLDGVTEAFILLKNFGLDPMDGTLQAIADQSATLGARQETLMGISLALGQAWGAQRLQGQDIMQMINQGVPVWALLEKVTGRTGMELRRMSEAGELGRDTIVGLIREMGKVNAGASAAQMDTWAGSVSNLKDAWAEFLNLIAEAGLLEHFKMQIQEITAALAEMSETGELQAKAQEIADAIITIASAIKSGVVFVYEWRDALLALATVAAGFKLVGLAQGIVGLIGPMTAAGVASAGAAARIGVLAKAVGLLRAAGWGAVAVQVGKLVLAMSEYRAVQDEIETARQDDIQKLRELTAAQQDYADVTVLSAEQLAQMTATEIASYQLRLQAARDHYRKLRDVQSRVDMREDGPAAPASEQALEAARQARMLAEELAKVDQAHQQRAALESQHKDLITQIKREETDAIKTQLGEQLKAYDDATKKLEKAQKERLAVEEFFQQARARLSAPQQDEAPRSFMDMASLMSSARTALAGGEFEKSIELSQEAARALEELREAGEFKGELGKLQSLGFLSQLEQIATEAAKAQEGAAEANVKKAEQAITELVSKAEFLKMIEIGFDGDTAEANAEVLRKRLQDKLANNPIIVPVQLQDTQVDPRIDQLLDNAPRRASGGLLSGPGTETSDSILLWGSKNEYMLRAAAVRHYGLPFIEAINRMRLPKFANGGLIGNLAIPGPLPAPAMGTSGAPVHLHLDGREFPLSGAPDTVDEIQRVFAREALKRGRRVR